MIQNNETPNDKLDQLRRENEEKKKEIAEKYGVISMNNSTEHDLPPEIESLFLNHIMAFEDAYASANPILLYNYVEKPAYRKVEDLTDEELTEELNRLTGLLYEHQIILDTICYVSEREQYRFITEELFFKEIDDMHIQGMDTRFIYEEFHPNHEHDIRQHTHDFINSYLDKENDFYMHFLTSEAEKADWHLHFRQAFSSFQLNSFSISELHFDTDKANVQITCDIVGKIEGSVESLRFSGVGELSLLYQWGFWCVDSLKLPRN